MKKLFVISLLVALVLAIGEIVRWWGDPRFLPLAFDELLVAIAMIAAAFGLRVWGAAPLTAAWGLYNGLVLSLLVPTLDHLMFGPAKPSAEFYSAVLGVMQIIGIWGLSASIALCRARHR